jgi:hypothetical protein
MHLLDRLCVENVGLYFGNYFSSYQLFQFLTKQSIYALGTVRVDRFAHTKLLSDKEMKKKGRGSSCVSLSADGVVLTKWYDNKGVVVGSNFIAIGQQDECKRWDSVSKQYIQVTRRQ